MPLARRIGRPGLIGTVARTAVIAGTAQATSNAVNHRQADKQQQAWDAQQAEAARAQAEQQAAVDAAVAQATAAQAAAAPAPAAGNGAALMAHLQQLGDLHASGVLDDSEFVAAKAKLLA